MTDREKLTQLIYDNPEYYLSEGKCREIADHLIANGVTFASAVPGPSDADPNIMELCFHNGEQHMKDKIISKFQGVAESMACITLAQAIKMVEDL